MCAFSLFIMSFIGLNCDNLISLLGNRASFGQSGAVAPLVNYLTSSSVAVHRSTSVALYQLSKDPWNCVTMHQNGVVPHLLRLIGNYSSKTQVKFRYVLTFQGIMLWFHHTNNQIEKYFHRLWGWRCTRGIGRLSSKYKKTCISVWEIPLPAHEGIMLWFQYWTFKLIITCWHFIACNIPL